MNTIDKQELKNRLIQEGYVEAFGLDQTINRLLNLDGKAAEMLKAWMDEGIIPEFDEIEGIDSKVLREQLKMKEPAIILSYGMLQKDPKINEKREKYQELNKQGIKYYKQEKYDLALEMFVEALKKSPSNSNATINKAQALLKLASSGELDKNKKDLYLRECANTLSTLDNIYLGKSLTQRVNSIKEEIEKLLG